MIDDSRTLAVRLGKAQIEAMFARQDVALLDDSEFLPMLEAVLTVYEDILSDAATAEEIAQQTAEGEATQDPAKHAPAATLLRRLCGLCLLRCSLLLRRPRGRRRDVALCADRAAAAEARRIRLSGHERGARNRYANPK